MTPAERPVSSDELRAALGDVRIRFWVCPVREHRRRNDERGGPVLTVEWRDGIAHCTAPGCSRTSRTRAQD